MSHSLTSWLKWWEPAESQSERKVSDGKSRANSPNLHSDFIKGKKGSTESFPHQSDSFALWRYRIRRITMNPCVTQMMAVVVLLDALCNIYDIDARARGQRTLDLVHVGSFLCLLLYTVELCMMVVGQGSSLLKDAMFYLDICVILGGYVEIILEISDPHLADRVGFLAAIRLLRLGRVFRLLRLFGKMRALRELQKLVLMASTCLKTLIWSFVFLMVVMTIWAMLLVEIVHPLIQEMHQKDPEIFQGCEYCLRATSSVMNSNLLLFKTVIAGDSWGQVAVPVMENHPATAIIWVGSQLTLVFGVLNLIVAVVVDTFADARDRDILNLAEEMEHDLEADKLYLERMFDRIDEAGAGRLSLEELVEGARKDYEFQSRLRVMDIDEADLVQLFDMIDTDGSGFIEPNEFIKPLSRWVHDSKTAPRFIKYNMLRIMQEQQELQQKQEELRMSIEKNFTEMARRMVRPPPGPVYEDSLGETEALESLQAGDSTFGLAEFGKVDSLNTEVPERPNRSQPVTLPKAIGLEAELQVAVGRLEEILKLAVESAIKDSTGIVREALLDLKHMEEPPPSRKDVFPGLQLTAPVKTESTTNLSTARRAMATEPLQAAVSGSRMPHVS